jgi:hypothetical protein
MLVSISWAHRTKSSWSNLLLSLQYRLSVTEVVIHDGSDGWQKTITAFVVDISFNILVFSPIKSVSDRRMDVSQNIVDGQCTFPRHNSIAQSPFRWFKFPYHVIFSPTY